jgi:hypothetical protein
VHIDHGLFPFTSRSLVMRHRTDLAFQLDDLSDHRLHRLCRRVDRCRYRREYVHAIRSVARSRHPEAIEILAALLDRPGVVGREATHALVRFNADAAPAMWRILRESVDATAVRNARWVLCRIGPGTAHLCMA